MDHIQARRISDTLTGRLVYPDPQTVHVSKQATAREEGTLSKPFKTIAAALAHAATLTPSATKRIVVLIHPGDYTETGLTGVQYVDLKGVERDSCVLESADANDILAVNVADVRLDSLTFRSTSTGLPLDVQASGVVDVFGCRFDAADASSRVEVDGGITLTECDLDGSGTAILVGNAGTIEVTKCTANGHIQTSSDFVGRWSNLTSLSGLGTADLELSQCRISGGMSYASSGTLRLDGNDIIYSIGAALWIQASCTASFTDNTFSAAAGFGDIYVTAGTTTVLAFSGNKMGSRGVYAPGSIFQLPDTVTQINVGGPYDSFYDFRHVLDAVTGDCTIKLCKNMLYSGGTYITMDHSYNITVDVDKFVLSANPDFFTGLGGFNLSGGGTLAFKSNAVNGRSQGRLYFVGDKAVTFTHHVHFGKIVFEAATTSAARLDAYDSEIRSDSNTNQPVVVIQSAAPVMHFENCGIRPYYYGAQTQYAFVWEGVQNDSLSLSRCVVWGGLPGENPFNRTGAETPVYKSTYTEYTSNPQTGAIWGNSILDGVNGDIYLDNLVPTTGTVLPNYDQILWVAKADNGPEVGTFDQPFHSVFDAMAAANALTPSASNVILIFVLPGIYTENTNIFLSQWVHLVGHDRHSVILRRTTTGYLMRAGNSNSSIRELTIESQLDDMNMLATYTGAPQFIGCIFKGNSSSYPYYSLVSISSSGSAEFIDCEFYNATSTRTIISSGVGSPKFYNCRIRGEASIGGPVVMHGCTLLDGRIELDGDGDADFVNCYFKSTVDQWVLWMDRATGFRTSIEGCYFESETMTVNVYGSFTYPTRATLRLVGNTFIARDAFWTGLYLQTWNEVEFTEFSGNSINGGGVLVGVANSAVVLPSGCVRRIGGNRDSFYPNGYTMQTLLNGIRSDDTRIEVMTDLPLNNPAPSNIALVAPTSYTGTVIEGVGRGVTIYGAVGVVVPFSIGSDVSVEFRNIRLIADDAIFVRLNSTTGGQLILRNVELIGSIYVLNGDGGTSILVEDTDITQHVAGSVILISHATPEIVIRQSRLYGTPPIYWSNGIANNNVKIAYSALKHFSGTNPFEQGGGVTPNYRSHHSCYEVDPETGGVFTNLVAGAQRFDSVDVNTFY